jgi:5-methylcytosine-specific restriction protein A
MPHMPPTHKPPKTTAGKQHRVRSPDDQFYSRANWRNLRLWHLRHYPLCADPFGRHAEDHVTVPATDVHHTAGRHAHPETTYSEEDLESLCHSCHSAVTAREKLGAGSGGNQDVHKGDGV